MNSLPEGAKPVVTGDIPQHADFAQVVAQSKESIANQTAQVMQGKRGRKPLPRDANGNIIRPGGRRQKLEIAKETSNHTSVETQTDTSAQDISEILVRPIQAASYWPANKYKIPELAFSEEESRMCAGSINQVVSAFFPDLDKLDPKSAAILGAAMTFGAVIGAKRAIYLEVQRQRNQKKPPEPVKDESPEVTEHSTLNHKAGLDQARAYFG